MTSPEAAFSLFTVARGRPSAGVAEVRVRDFRSVSVPVHHAPVEHLDPPDPAHANAHFSGILSEDASKNAKKRLISSAAKALAHKANQVGWAFRPKS